MLVYSRKKRLVVLLLGISTLLGASGNSCTTDLESTYTNGFEQENSSVDLKMLYGGAIAVGGALTWALYKTNDPFKKTLDASYERIQEAVKRKGLQLILKIEEIKDDGITRKDVTKVAGVLGSCYLAKKCFDFFHIKELLLQGNVTLVRKAFSLFKEKYLKLFLGAGAAALSLYSLLRFTDYSHIFDRLELTREQREKCSDSEELSRLEQEKEYRELLTHKEFVRLLTDEQQEIQQALITEYEHNGSWDEDGTLEE